MLKRQVDCPYRLAAYSSRCHEEFDLFCPGNLIYLDQLPQPKRPIHALVQFGLER